MPKGGTPVDLRAIVVTALEDPALALVRLWRVLRDRPLLDRSFHDHGKHTGKHERLAEAVHAALDEGDAGPLPPAIEAIYALVTLRELDRHLEGEALGLPHVATPIHPDAGAEGPGDGYFVVPLGRGRRAPFNRGAHHLRPWLSRHAVVPMAIRGTAVDVRMERAVDDGILERGRKPSETIRIWTEGHDDGVEPVWLPLDAEGRRVVAPRLTNEAWRWERIRSVLERATAADLRADGVLLPELTITEAILVRVQEWLCRHQTHHGLGFVVPGSLHREEATDTGSAWRNETVVLDRRGEIVHRHQKLRGIGWLRADGTHDRREDTAPIASIPLYQTASALVATPICLDFCDEEPGIAALWDALAAELVLVPSMGGQTTLDAHRRRAAEHHRLHGSAVVVAHQHLDERGCGIHGPSGTPGATTSIHDCGCRETGRAPPGAPPEARRKGLIVVRLVPGDPPAGVSAE